MRSGLDVMPDTRFDFLEATAWQMSASAQQVRISALMNTRI
jgi:hypothetical protein